MTRRVARIIQGDCREVLPTLPAESVQCVVTSPPYLWLRDYGVAGQIGLEATLEEYLATLVEVFREVRRVLRKDGVLWLNMGDIYNDPTRIRPSSHQPNLNGYVDGTWGKHAREGHIRNVIPRGENGGLKRKDLVGLPWRLAFALQADGWWLRADCIWAKPNPMPSSVLDRPTVAHEYVFLLSRSARYWYDAEAVRTEAKVQGKQASVSGWAAGDGPHDAISHNQGERRQRQRGHERPHNGFNERWDLMTGAESQAMGANLRTVWPVATRGCSGAHFATFPEALAEICVRAGSSERGRCPACGAAWRRLLDLSYANPGNRETNGPRSIDNGEISAGYTVRGERESRTLGWEPGCGCDAGDPIPCLILDPFSGSGTTGVVALREGREYVGVEVSPEYVELSRRRIVGDAPLWNVVEVESCSR